MPNQGTLKVDDKGSEIQYTVKASRSKYIYIRFKSDLKLEVVLPHFCSKDPEKIVDEKREWIIKKYNELLQRRYVLNGKELMIDGKKYPLITKNSKKNCVKLSNGLAIIKTKDDNIIQTIKFWMKKRTIKYLNKELPFYSKKLNIEYANFYVMDLKKWGYCNRRRELFFNLQLAALPKKLKEYVVLHELTHNLEFNHSKRFHEILKGYCPDYRNRERLLNQIVLIRENY
ncbi:MAG: SprT family zinc-dependent metalloprotease [Nitrososphaeria archaeon]